MGYLDATLDTDSLRGIVGKGIILTVNDPVRPKVTLAVKALVMGSALVLPPETLSLKNVKESGIRRILRKDPTESGTLAVGNVQTTVPWLVATARPLETTEAKMPGLPVIREGDWLLEIKLRPPIDYGSHEENVFFDTGLARHPRFTLGVECELRPPVSLPSETLRLPASGRETVVLSVRKGLDPDALTAEARPAGLGVALERAGDRFYKANITWSGGALDDGTVVFRVADEELAMNVHR